jgi:hypothetical protein
MLRKLKIFGKRKKRPVQEGREPLCGALIFPGRDITMLRNHYLGVGRTTEQGGEKHPEEIRVEW